MNPKKWKRKARQDMVVTCFDFYAAYLLEKGTSGDANNTCDGQQREWNLVCPSAGQQINCHLCRLVVLLSPSQVELYHSAPGTRQTAAHRSKSTRYQK